MTRRLRIPLLGWLLPAGFLALAACTPEIGDKCILSTDCSLRGDRLCDTSQPGGYCTIFNCRGNGCPTASCILFQPSVQGCGFDDRSPSRTGRSFCVGYCESDEDCRDGYVCTDPRLPPWNAIILDDNQTNRVCLVKPDDGAKGAKVTAGAPVCKADTPSVPDIDAAPPQITPVTDAPDATVSDAARPDAGAGTDASLDAGAGDASADAPEGG
jgi:hypothetical protein